MDNEPTLDERIAGLTSLRDDPPDGTDLPGLLGMLGEAHLEAYELRGAPESLDRAIDHLAAAADAAPYHQDMAYWCCALGTGHSSRADRLDSALGYDRAVHWFERLLVLVPEGDPKRDDAALLLMDAYWDQYYEVRCDPAADAATAVADAREVLHAIGSVPVSDDPVSAGYARLLLGLANIACFETGGGRAHLDAAIDLLATALDALSQDSPRYVLAGAWLVDGYRRRGALDDDASSIDLAIATGQWLSGVCAEAGADRLELECTLAQAFQLRWTRDENPADLDQAITHWRRALDVHEAPWPANMCGDLLRQRAELTGKASDLPEAIRLLELATAEAATGAEDLWLDWFLLGQAHHLHWQLEDDPRSLARAADSLDMSLEQRPPDGTITLELHVHRILFLFELNQVQPISARLRHGTEQATAALDSEHGATFEVRAMLAGMVALAKMAVNAPIANLDIEGILDLTALALELGNAPPGWHGLIHAIRGSVQLLRDSLNFRSRGDSGVGELLRAAVADRTEEMAGLPRQLLPFALRNRASRFGDIRAARAARVALQGLTVSETEHAHLLDAMRATLLAHDRAAQGNPQAADGIDLMLPPAVAELISRLSAPSDGLGMIQPLVDTANRMVAADLGLDELRAAVAQATELVGRIPQGQVMRVVAAAFAGAGELEVTRRDPGDVAAATRSVRWFEEVVTGLEPWHPLWASACAVLAEGLRRTGRPDGCERGRRLGVETLRAHARRVLLQSGTDYAIVSARQASAVASKFAGWCLEDGAYEEAVAVLDAGRGLVLSSATASRDVARLLADLGHHDLAREWSESTGLGRNQITGDPLPAVAEGAEFPDDLRSRVLRALDEAGHTDSGLLPLVSTDQIRAALSATGFNGLVYLVPSTDTASGAAIIVPASGAIETLALPDLRADEPLAAYARHPRAGRDLTADAADPPTSSQRLDELCQWAWSAAMQAIVDRVRDWGVGSPARLVLIPMGSLALVPWHAAYMRAGRERRYAVQDIAFSYSVSARMFCATAGHPVEPVAGALVIGDPLGDLPFAGAEARAIHERFYPYGRYLGRPHKQAAGPGSPEEVVRWLVSADAARSTLHFACHAKVDTASPADAHLVLAGGRLTARRLIEVSRLAALVPHRVFLAACTTNVTGADYDEAFSLATAFLSAGAHTVFGTLWPVPDEGTSVLMYMVHHFLNVESCTPIDALHRAQLWMLDPDRTVVDGMPVSLRDSAGRPECADAVSWAAFTHLGR
ncbi:CHAT domain-containing tetratricopeptide repeat protein [Allorhizocola rhizosphaerae]|uniref:CHAT domain-containing tetratricopeptide repeat protein n=1 Tax=Allorhizocola rhizosphaerae TaxID=1872709 RepID=UPI000E3E4A94|nr:CHAT domain-containing protein [Allorhizocola rhizosphaerae]